MVEACGWGKISVFLILTHLLPLTHAYGGWRVCKHLTLIQQSLKNSRTVGKMWDQCIFHINGFLQNFKTKSPFWIHTNIKYGII